MCETKRMKIVQLLGGLGNQMFQYAFYKGLKQRFKKVKADISEFATYELHNGYELNDAFGIELDLISHREKKLYCNKNNEWAYSKLRTLLRLSNSVFIEEKEFQYDESIFKDQESRYYIGYWQNERYFQDLRKPLLRDFTYNKPLSKTNSFLLSRIKNSNSVSIHVRRGDYIGHAQLGGICDKAYYSRAIQIVESKVKNPFYYIFSNDIDWCKENLTLNSVHFCEENSKKKSVVDLFLMSQCKCNIIANSSFSWWAAWLNENSEKTVVAPKKWINAPNLNDSDVLPSSWIKA